MHLSQIRPVFLEPRPDRRQHRLREKRVHAEVRPFTGWRVLFLVLLGLGRDVWGGECWEVREDQAQGRRDVLRSGRGGCWGDDAQAGGGEEGRRGGLGGEEGGVRAEEREEEVWVLVSSGVERKPGRAVESTVARD